MIDIIKIYNEGQSKYKIGDSILIGLSHGVWHYHISKDSTVGKSITIYELMLNPKYNLIPTLETSDKYNKAFKEWLKGQTKKDFCIILHKGQYYLVVDVKVIEANLQGEIKLPMTAEMLLGYHIEFIKGSMV